MKTASKVFLILSMVSAPLSIIMLLVQKNLLIDILVQAGVEGDADILNRIYNIMLIVVAVFSLIAISIGILAIRKLNHATSKNELVLFGVLSLIFVSLVGGILMLCVKDEDLNAGRTISLNEISAPTQDNPNQDQQ